MSVRVSSAVWALSEHKGSELVVLLALADMARDDGVSWPGFAHIAAKSRLSRRQAVRVIATLQKSEELELLTQGGGSRANMYRINLRLLYSREALKFEGGFDDTGDADVTGDMMAPLSSGVSPVTSGAPGGVADVTLNVETLEETSEKTEGAGTAHDDGHLPGLAPPTPPSPPASPDDSLVDELWTFYVGIFGDALGVKELTAPRRKHLGKALAATARNVDVCKRAVLGLQEYRKHKPGKTGLDVIFSTGPQDRSNLTEKIEWWASQAPDEGRPEVPGSVPSHERARVLELVASVLKPERMQLTDSQKERCDESAMILRRQFGLKVRSDGSGKWLGLEEVPKGEA